MMMKVMVLAEVPDPAAYKAGFKRRLVIGPAEVPCDKDYIRLLKKGYLDPMDAMSAKRAGRPVKAQKPEPKAKSSDG